VPSIAVKLGVTVHELEDALVTGDIETAAKMLRTTSAVIAKKLGVSVADLQTAFAQTTPK
jgi:phosphotransacetylase